MPARSLKRISVAASGERPDERRIFFTVNASFLLGPAV